MTIARILSGKGGRVLTVPPECSLREVVGLLVENRIGAVIIAESADPVAGILSERDIVTALAERGVVDLAAEARSLMTSPVITCRPSDTIDQVMAMMTDHRIRHVPVMDDGRLVGIVSIGDLVKQRIADAEQEAEQIRAYIAS